MTEERATRKSKRTRHSRLAVLVAVIGFVLSQGGLRFIIEQWRPDWRDPTFEVKVNRLLAHAGDQPKPLTIVFLGSSQTVFGAHTRLIGAELSKRLGRPVQAFNFGSYAAGPLTSLVYMNRLLERGIRPDLVLVEAQPRHIYERNPPWDLKLFPPQVLGYHDVGLIKRYGGEIAADYRRDWWQNLPAPVYAHRLSVLCLAAPNLLPYQGRMETWDDVDATGWKRFPEIPLSEADKQHILEQVRETQGPSLRIVGDPCPLAPPLLELLARLRTEKIRTSLLVLPEGPTFRSLYRPHGIPRFRADLTAAATCLKTPVVDLLEEAEEADFHDSFHLLETGAEKTARAIAARLMENEAFSGK